MPNDASLRKHLVALLTKAEAHVNFEEAIKDLPPGLRYEIPSGAEHCAWQQVEHMRITLWDILEFSRDSTHVSPDWPVGYWPASSTPGEGESWDRSVDGFRNLLKEMCELVSDEKVDLFAKIPHGDGQTVLREAMLVADHNAYHVGQLVLLRRLLGAWR